MLFLLSLVTLVVAEPVKIGDIITLHHGVSGSVYAVDASTLMVKNFVYDGAGPDAFFWVGTEGTPSNVSDEATAILAHPFKGVHYAYRDESAPVLSAASNEQVTLFLPPHLKVTDLKWFSVWCRKFTVDFGSFLFDGSAIALPSSPSLPHPIPGPSDNSVESSPEPEPEPETEPEPEVEPEHHDHDHHDGSYNGVEPESEPSTGNAEPEPKGPNHASSLVSSSLLSLLITLVLAAKL